MSTVYSFMLDSEREVACCGVHVSDCGVHEKGNGEGVVGGGDIANGFSKFFPHCWTEGGRKRGAGWLGVGPTR
jgi:hypothetical protein